MWARTWSLENVNKILESLPCFIVQESWESPNLVVTSSITSRHVVNTDEGSVPVTSVYGKCYGGPNGLLSGPLVLRDSDFVKY